jgi:hypothetical protein
MRWLALVVLAACTHVPLSTEPSTLALHAPELAANGRARVEVDQGGTQVVDAEDVVAITLPGHQRSHLWGLVTTGRPDETRELTIRNLVAGCPGDGCLATRAAGSIHVGERRRVDPARLGIGAFGAAATVASLACLAICHDPGGWAYVGTGLAVTAFVVPLSTVF